MSKAHRGPWLQQGIGGDWLSEYAWYWICNDGLHKYYELPEDVSEVRVVVQPHETDYTHTVEMLPWSCRSIRLDGKYIMVTMQLYLFFEQFNERILFVEIEYR